MNLKILYITLGILSTELLAAHAVFGQDLQGLAPGGVDRLVLGGRDEIGRAHV